MGKRERKKDRKTERQKERKKERKKENNMIQQGKTNPMEDVEANIPAAVTEQGVEERMTCCCIDQPKYFNCCNRVRITRRTAYIIGAIVTLGVVGLIVGLIMKAALEGSPYKQGDAFSAVQMQSCANVDVFFNATDFRVDPVPGTGCQINYNWFDTVIADNTIEGVCCQAAVYVPGVGKVSKFIATSSGGGTVYTPPGGDFKLDVSSGGWLAIGHGGEVSTLSGSVSSGSTVWVDDSVKVNSWQVKTKSGGRIVHGESP